MLPVLVAEGTFFDGEIYATLARNYAIGLGDLWNPHLSLTIHPQWHEHPPLGLWIMSASYRLLGDHLFVEHAYSLLTAIVNGLLIVGLWRRLLRDDPPLARLGWLPLLMWLMNPQVTWSYSNAMLENTSTFFVLLSVHALVRALDRVRFPWGWTVAAGAAIVAAVLTKGPVGLFPMVAVVLAAPILGRPTPVRTIGMSSLLLGVMIAAGGVLWLWPDARLAIRHYLDQQLLASLGGRRGGSPDMMRLVGNLGETLLPALGLLLILGSLGWRRFGSAMPGRGRQRLALWLLAVGLSGSLPLGLSPRQSLFYLGPAFPFLALGLAVLAAPATSALLANTLPGGRAHRVWTTVAALLLSVILIYSGTRVGTYARDKELRADVKLIVSHLENLADGEPGSRRAVALCRGLRHDFTLITCLNRYGGTAPDHTNTQYRYLVSRQACEQPPLDQWRRVPLETHTFHLFERRSDDS